MTERDIIIDDLSAYETEPRSFYEYLLRLATDLPGMYETADGKRTLFGIPDALTIPVCMPIKNHVGEVSSWKVTLIIKEPANAPTNVNRLLQLMESRTLADYGLQLNKHTYIFDATHDDEAEKERASSDTTELNLELEFKPTTSL